MQLFQRLYFKSLLKHDLEHVHIQSLAKKLVVSVSKIRKLAMVFLFVEIQKLLLYMVLKTLKFAISFSIKTFKNLKVTRILG